ncbi:hypothetical protein ABZX95_17180 [Streptomyces sp. NPDC004232]|uniref:hypothetical protein n=1 Tax=Streptomyces sp. NPDC004232 TaxID=3154454 RepID=UPI0033A46214
MSDESPLFPEGASAGQLLHALLAPPQQAGPPYTHDVTPRPCAACTSAGDPECRDGLLYRDGGEELDYVDVYVGRCTHACHRVQPSVTITEVER